MNHFCLIVTLFVVFLRLVSCDENRTVFADNRTLEYRSPNTTEGDWHGKEFGCGIPIQETLEQSASVSLTFRGTFAQAFLLSANTTSSADIFMDGRYQTTIDTWSNTSYSSCLYKYWNSSKLTVADHTITVTHRKLNGSHPNLEFVKYTYVSAPRKKGGLSLGAKIGIGIGISVALSITCGRASRNSRR